MEELDSLPPEDIQAAPAPEPAPSNDKWFDLPETKQTEQPAETRPEQPKGDGWFDLPEAKSSPKDFVNDQVPTVGEKLHGYRSADQSKDQSGIYERVPPNFEGVYKHLTDSGQLDELKAQFKKEFPDEPFPAGEMAQRILEDVQQRRMGEYLGQQRQFKESPADYFSRRNPFAGPIYGFAYGKDVADAQKRIKNDEGTDADYQLIAKDTAQKERDQAKSEGRQKLDSLSYLPGFLAETAATGGANVAGRGLAAAGLRGAAETLPGRVAANAVGVAAQTAATPSLYVADIPARNAAAGRDSIDVRGAAEGLSKAVIDMEAFAGVGALASKAGTAIMGAAGVPARALLPKSAMDRVVHDMVVGGVEFPVAQQAADLVTASLGLREGYGVLGDVANGKYGDATKELMMQVGMGMAFHGATALRTLGVPTSESIKSLENGWDAENARRAQESGAGDVRQGPPESPAGRVEAPAGAPDSETAGRETPPTPDPTTPSPGATPGTSESGGVSAPSPAAVLPEARAAELAARAKIDADNPEGAIPSEWADALDKVPLTSQERKVLTMRLGDAGMTHEAIGAHPDVQGDRETPYTRERIRQIEDKAIGKIAKHLQETVGVQGDETLSVNDYKKQLKAQLAETLSSPDRLSDTRDSGGRPGKAFIEQERLEKAHNDAVDAHIAELEKARDEANAQKGQAKAGAEAVANSPAGPADKTSLAGPPGPESARPRIVESAKRAADAARDRLNAKYGSRLQSGIDPTDIPDFVTYFGGRVIEKGYDFAKFTADAIANFGENIRPYLKEIWSQTGGKPESTGIKNATVDKELEAMGLPPAKHGETTDFATAWETAKRTIADDPEAGKRLIDNLAQTKRPPTRDENALLAHEMNRRINERDAAQQQLNNAKTDAEKADVRIRVAQAKDEYAKAADVVTKVGTASSESLNFRRMMVNRDFSLAQMEREYKATKGDKFTDADQAHVEAQNKKIADLQKKLDDYEKGASEPISRVEAARKQVDDAWKAFAKVAEGKLFANPVLDPEMIGAAANLAKAYAKLGIAHVADFIGQVRERAGKMTPELERVLTAAWEKENAPAESRPRGPMSDEARLQAFKTRTQNRLDELAGLKEPRPKPTPLALDPEAMRLKAELEQAKQQWTAKLAENEYANRSLGEKVRDTFLQWRRGFILSSPTVFSKLGSAAGTRLGLTPMEEAMGSGIGVAFPGLAKRAQFEGGLNVRAEAKALTDGFTKGMADAWSVLKTGKSELDFIHNPNKPESKAFIEYIGNMHGAMKAPVKRAAYARAMEKGFEWAIKNGMDPHDPAVQEQVSMGAFKQANRSIFMQDNIASDAFKSSINYLERQGVGGKALSTAGQYLMPIVKVPTNIVGEALNNAFGSVIGSARLANAYAKGIESLPPEQADSIMRQLKKGSIGLGILALGFYNSQNLGGFYQPGEKRRKDELGVGEAKIGGTTIPAYLMHSPLGLVYQMGGTIGKLWDKKGPAVAAAKGLFGLLEETPFVRETVDINKAIERPEQFAGQQAKSLLIPGGVQWAARNLDRDAQGNQVKRKTKGVLQELESGIPGLRERLPPR